jgi:3-oxoacyl-[acyl-carrier protein] reductase
MNNLKDKVVLITGAGKGAGKNIALAFAEHGALMVLNDISPINVDEVTRTIASHGGTAVSIVEDVAKKVAAQAIINQTVDRFGRVDILINCANVEPRFDILSMDEWDWHRVLDVNLTGAFLMSQSAARVMREQKSGVIINLAPIAGRDSVAYIASKIGLIGFTRQAAKELSGHNIRVHAIGNGLAEFATRKSKESIGSIVLSLSEDETINGEIINIE